MATKHQPDDPIAVTISGTSWKVDENGNIDFTDREGCTRCIGKIDYRAGNGGRSCRGRIFGTYTTAEGHSYKIVSAMLVAGYVTAMELNEPGELPF